ncbi:MAG: DUF1614 domain-containing protein [Betaproteobacteria bacterium]|nr:MAG: DUF1614 domain-containing protein [Betaproteobacteria bacterium]
MHPLGIHYYPLTLPFLLALLGVLIALSFLVVLRALQFAYAQLGIAPRYFFTWLFASLAGSYVNLPIVRFSPEQMTQLQVIPFYGVPYVIPTVETWPGTVLAVNVGGAIIPILLSLFLIVKNGLYRMAAWGVTIVSLACYVLAEPVPGLGIAIPVFYPPVIAAIVALLLSRQYAAPLAYACGSLGTLIGADLMNLGNIRGLGAPVMSIGGAGTFDGIFVTGLIAVLIAGIVSRRKRVRSH